MSYLIAGGLSKLSTQGVVPELLTRSDTKLIVLLDNLSGGRSFPPPLDARIKIVAGDTFNEPLVESLFKEHEVTHVIDFASLAAPEEGATPVEIARTSVVGFTHLLDAMRHYGKVQRCVLVSRQQPPSPSVADNKESTPPAPSSMHSASCMAAEAMLHSYVISYRMQLVVARVSQGAFTPAPTTAISIGDAARGVLSVLEKGVAPEIYNIGSKSDPSFPIDRAMKELGWEPTGSETTAGADVQLVDSSSFAKILVFGHEGALGQKLLEKLEKSSYVLAKTNPGLSTDEEVRREIIQTAPSHIILTDGRADGKDPSYYDEEPRPARLLENTRENLYSPWFLSATSERLRIQFICVCTEAKPETSHASVATITAKLLKHFPRTQQITCEDSTTLPEKIHSLLGASINNNEMAVHERQGAFA